MTQHVFFLRAAVRNWRHLGNERVEMQKLRKMMGTREINFHGLVMFTWPIRSHVTNSILFSFALLFEPIQRKINIHFRLNQCMAFSCLLSRTLWWSALIKSEWYKCDTQRHAFHNRWISIYSNWNGKNKTFSARVNIESIYSMRMPAAVCVWKIWCSIVENSYNIIVEGVFDLRM